MTTDTNPLRAPWACAESGVITDCDGRIVAVLTLGNEGCDDARGRLIAKAPELLATLRHVVEWHGSREGGNGLLGQDNLLPPERQQPEIAGAMRLIASVEMRA